MKDVSDYSSLLTISEEEADQIKLAIDAINSNADL